MTTVDVAASTSSRKFFYGWTIVGAGFFANIASAFALASTLSIFLKPLTAELGASRGVFPYSGPVRESSAPWLRPLSAPLSIATGAAG